jgi:shikimate kinase
MLEPSQRLVLATGGGVVDRADNRAWLARSARCVYLSVPLEILAARLRSDPAPRPPLLGLDPVDELAALLARREPHYRALAEVVIECGDATPAELVERVRSALSVSTS